MTKVKFIIHTIRPKERISDECEEVGHCVLDAFQTESYLFDLGLSITRQRLYSMKNTPTEFMINKGYESLKIYGCHKEKCDRLYREGFQFHIKIRRYN
jgi:hypothetical protein